ncbi:MAG: transcriptional regulator [Saprospiraceae bacterium]
MQLEKAQEKFVSEWGRLSCNWGVNKAMGQIHAFLLISANALTCDNIMETLEMSRGNVNMNVKNLIHWGLVKKGCRKGCRKDYYTAEKDLWKVFQLIISHRKRKELDPLLDLVKEMAFLEANCEKSAEFCKVLKELEMFSTKADNALKLLLKTESNWLTKPLSRMI